MRYDDFIQEKIVELQTQEQFRGAADALRNVWYGLTEDIKDVPTGSNLGREMVMSTSVMVDTLKQFDPVAYRLLRLALESELDVLVYG